MARTIFLCLFGRFSLFTRRDVGCVPVRPMVLGRSGFVLAVVLLGLAQKSGQRVDVQVAESSSGKAGLDLLKQPSGSANAANVV